MTPLLLSKSELLTFYRRMQIIRLCEERLAQSHQRGLIHGACHTYVGQEAVAVGVCANLRPDDVVLLLTSGELGGLIRTIPRLVETKYPR